MKKYRPVQWRLQKIHLWFAIAAITAAAAASAQAVSPADLWQAATQAYSAKKYLAAASLLEQYLLAQLPKEKIDGARFFLAETFRLGGQSDKANAIYAELARVAQDDSLRSSAKFREAEGVFNQGDYARAEGLLSRLAKDGRAEFLLPQIRLALVKTDLRLRRKDTASKIFEDLLQELPRSLLDPEIKFLYGILKEYEGRTLDALRIYDELSDNPLAKLFSGAILESQGRFMAAVEAYNQVLSSRSLQNHLEMALFFKARSFYKSGDFLSAQNLCHRFIAQYPRSTLTPKVNLLLLLVQLGQARYGEVLAGYTAGAGVWKALSISDQALIEQIAAEAELNLNQFGEAAVHFTKASGPEAPYREEALLKLAYCRQSAGDAGAAVQSMNDYFRETKNPASLAHLLAVKLYLAVGKDALAFRSLRQLVETGDALANPAFYLLGAFYLNERRYQNLTAQWALLEKKLESQEPGLEYRESAAWSRLMAAEAYFRQGEYNLALQMYQRALTLYPYGQVPRLVGVGRTWCSFRLNDYPDVLVQSERLSSQLDPKSAVASEIKLLRAQAFFNLKRYDDAVLSYRAWLEAPGSNAAAPAVWFEMGWAHYLNQSYLDAVETWQTLARKYPESPEAVEALSWVADTYFQAGKNAEARDIYTQLLEKKPRDEARAGYALRVAQTFYNEQRDDEAIRAFTALIQAHPGTEEATEAEKGIESALFRITDRLDSIQAFRDFIAQFPQSPLTEEIQYRIGEAYFQKEKFSESLAEFSAFVLTYTKSPRTPNAQYYIAYCQERLNNLTEAILQSKAFLVNYPQHELAPEVMFRLASIEFQMERYTEAAEHFAACADTYSLKEYQARAWYNAAVTYEKIKSPELALNNYRKLIDQFPDDPNLPVSLSRVTLLEAQQGRIEAVRIALANLVARQDGELSQKTRLALATLYQEQGQMDRQEEFLRLNLEAGLPRSQEYARGLIELASLYEGQKSWKDALAVYRRLEATTQEPKWREAAKKRIQLLQRILGQKRG